MARNSKAKPMAGRVRLVTTVEINLTVEEVETACRDWAVRHFGGKTVGSTIVDAQSVHEAEVSFSMQDFTDDSPELRGATVTVRNQIVADAPTSDGAGQLGRVREPA